MCDEVEWGEGGWWEREWIYWACRDPAVIWEEEGRGETSCRTKPCRGRGTGSAGVEIGEAVISHMNLRRTYE